MTTTVEKRCLSCTHWFEVQGRCWPGRHRLGECRREDGPPYPTTREFFGKCPEWKEKR